MVVTAGADLRIIFPLSEGSGVPQAMTVQRVPRSLHYNLWRAAQPRLDRTGWHHLADEVGQLAAAIYAYQRSDSPASLEPRVAQLIQTVLARRVKPILSRRLRPDDVEDVLSEVTIAVWRYRHSIRTEEVGRFIHAVAHRKLADQLRKYYREADANVGNPEMESGSLIDLLPARDHSVSGADQQVWELLRGSGLADQDLLVAYFLYLGVPKGDIASALGISPNTVTNALKRCREALTVSSPARAGGQG